MFITPDGVSQQYFARPKSREGYRATIRRHPWMPRTALAEWQLGALNSVLRHARRDVPFYADRLGGELTSLDELSTLPLLTRDEVLESARALHSRAFTARDTVDLHTGGTAGPPLTIRATPRAIERHYAMFTRFREWLGLPDRARVAAFGGRSTIGAGPAWARVAVGPPALICSADGFSGQSIDGYIEALVEFGPEIIDGYPSTLLPIARRMRTVGESRVRPMAVITSGDALTAFARRMIEEAFHCPVFDHYGAVEMVALISECRAGSYHINEDYGVVEIIHDGRPAQPGELGEIVATGLLNEAMPLIRYATGDMAIRGTTHCPCGRTFPTVERILGRVEESLTGPHGPILGRLDEALRGVSTVIETRIIQDAPDHVTVQAVSSVPIDPLESAMMMTELRHRLGVDIRADIVRVPSIARPASGRYRSVQALVPVPSARRASAAPAKVFA